MVNRQKKGAAYERHVSSLFRTYNYNARRGQQYCGANGDADVAGVPYLHIECKAHENGHGKLYEWLDQAKRDAREGEIPVVIHKRNYCNDLVTMEFSEWIKLYTEWEAGQNA